MMKRAFDIVVSTILLFILIVPLAAIALVVKLTSAGPAIHWSRRVGLKNSIFLMPKFRSMFIHAPQIATHLINMPENLITPVGRVLRKTSFDELPQLFSVLRGDMSLVGPRPALFNQDDLVALRTKYGIERLRPGVTGWAQVNGRDDLPIAEKVGYDREYLEKGDLLLDFKILVLTVFRVLQSKGVKH